MSAKLLILGLDGASWRVTLKMAAEGHMPTVARMLAEGSASPLLSTNPDISPTAWASFMTGKNPGQHGAYGFGMKIPGSYFIEPFSSRGRVQADTLWGILSRRNRRVAIINVPMTYPPERVNGIAIAGFGTPNENSPYMYPPELMTEMRNKLGPYILDVNWADYEGEGGIVPLLEELRRMTRRRADYGLDLLRREQWDLFNLVLVSTDRLQHCTWQYLEPQKPLTAEEESIRRQVLGYYTFLDEILQEFMSAAPEADVLLISDHGFCHFEANVQLNTFLQQNGFLSWEQKNRTDRWRSVLLFAKRLGMNRARFGKLAKMLGINEYKHLEKVSHRVNNICWSKTRAFAYTPNGVYFNLKGRESQGVVNPGAESDRLFDEVAEKLLQLRDPVTGNRVVHRVARPEEIYHGPKVYTAPDLMIAESDHRYVFNFNLYPGSNVFERSSWRTGNHDPEGILIASGPQIAHHQRPAPAKLEDVAPTALHLLGEAVPEDMDGEVVGGMLANQAREVTKAAADNGSGDANSGQGMSSEEQEMVFERLRGLGYFE